MLLYQFDPHACLTGGREKCYNFIYVAYIPSIIQSEPWCIVADPRVMCSEPAKFVAKLTDRKTDDNLLLLKCDFYAGHGPKSR